MWGLHVATACSVIRNQKTQISWQWTRNPTSQIRNQVWFLVILVWDAIYLHVCMDILAPSHRVFVNDTSLHNIISIVSIPAYIQGELRLQSIYHATKDTNNRIYNMDLRIDSGHYRSLSLWSRGVLKHSGYICPCVPSGFFWRGGGFHQNPRLTKITVTDPLVLRPFHSLQAPVPILTYTVY